jgi:hypothetical protein
MAFKGTFSSMPLPDLLQWLAQGRKTGRLQVRSPVGVTKKIFLEEGRVIAAASNEPREYLGHFLIARGLINEKQLETAMKTQAETAIKLGRILIMIGALDEAGLSAILDTKIKETVYSLFLWEHADFEFFEGEKFEGEFLPLSLDVTFMIMEGTRRMDEYVRIRAAIPDLNAVLELTGVYPDAEMAEDHPLAIPLMERLDGAKSLAAVALDLHAQDYDILSAAMALVEGNAARVTDVRAASVDSWQKQLQLQIYGKARFLFSQKDYAAAANLCQYLIQNNLHVAEAKEMLAECDKQTQVDWDAEVPLDQVPVLTMSLTQLSALALSPNEGFLASRIDGAYTVKSILKITPIPELDARRALKNLKDKKVILFKPKMATGTMKAVVVPPGAAAAAAAAPVKGAPAPVTKKPK